MNWSTIYIKPESAFRLSAGQHVVCILDGLAWITADAKDIIAGPNREIEIDCSETPVVISGMLGHGVMLDVQLVAALAA
jgi:hypothetical protein